MQSLLGLLRGLLVVLLRVGGVLGLLKMRANVVLTRVGRLEVARLCMGKGGGEGRSKGCG